VRDVAKGALHAFPMRGDLHIVVRRSNRVHRRVAGIPVDSEAIHLRQALLSQIRTNILFHVQKLLTALFH
jgi:hypothetical protein